MALAEEKIKYENLADAKQRVHTITTYITCTATREISILQSSLTPRTTSLNRAAAKQLFAVQSSPTSFTILEMCAAIEVRSMNQF
jgi:hypothetical protein